MHLRYYATFFICMFGVVIINMIPVSKFFSFSRHNLQPLIFFNCQNKDRAHSYKMNGVFAARETCTMGPYIRKTILASVEGIISYIYRTIIITRHGDYSIFATRKHPFLLRIFFFFYLLSKYELHATENFLSFFGIVYKKAVQGRFFAACEPSPLLLHNYFFFFLKKTTQRV